MLRDDIEHAQIERAESAKIDPHLDRVGVSFHAMSGLLVATGPEWFIDMVGSMMSAYQTNMLSAAQSPPESKPATPAK